MAGHNKWSSIKHKKAAVDAKRGKIFSRIARDISVAAGLGGGDPNNNPRLRTAIQAARDANMPTKNVENAIAKGTGELPGVVYEEITYEGYGPGGSAFIVTCTTDNKNRTAADVRHVFNKMGGNLGETGCVSYNFERKGQILVEAEESAEDTIMEAALEAGADDLENNGDGSFTIVTEARDELVENVRTALEERDIKVEAAEIQLVPLNTADLDPETAKKAFRMYEAFDELDDTQSIAVNFEFDEELMG